ncbi:MAG TPA: hypothetical protein VEC92_02375 [Nitrososphaerales archaeon]|nr:hypothetical protein [Nitrososphaerales archaeon]
MAEKRVRVRRRKGAQIIEEALLLSVALVALSLLVGGIESILKQSASYTSSIWDSISSAINGILGTLFHW